MKVRRVGQFCAQTSKINVVRFVWCLTLLELQSRCLWDKPLKLQVVCPQNGTAVLQGLISHMIQLQTCSSLRSTPHRVASPLRYKARTREQYYRQTKIAGSIPRPRRAGEQRPRPRARLVRRAVAIRSRKQSRERCLHRAGH